MLRGKEIIGCVAPMLGLPSVLTDFMWSFSQLVDFSNHYVCGPNQRIEYLRPSHAYHTLARNQVAKASCQLGKFLFMIDADHAPGPDLLFRLLNVMNKTGYDVVSGLYCHKAPPYNPTLWQWTNENAQAGTGLGHTKLVDWPRNEIMEVGIAGAGSLLIRTSVFRRIYDELGQEPFSTYEYDNGGKGGIVGEDFAFFHRLKQLGIKTICPTYIECHHLQVRPLVVDEVYDPGWAVSKEAKVKIVRREGDGVTLDPKKSWSQQ